MSKDKLEKRNNIISSAAKLFFDKGFSTTSINDIIEVTGGSKREIYSEFGSKLGLFEEIVTVYTNKNLERLNVTAFDKNDLEISLKEFGVKLVHSFFNPEVFGLYSLMFKEAKSFPELAARFYNSGPLFVTQKLSELLQKYVDNKEIKDISSSYNLAYIFVSLLRDKIQTIVMLNSYDTLDLSQIEAEVDLAIEVFLYGVKK